MTITLPPTGPAGTGNARRNTAQRLYLAGFGIAILILGWVTWLREIHIGRMQETARWVTVSHRVDAGTAKLLHLLVGVESLQGGYVLTGAPGQLERFELARTVVDAQQKQLASLIVDPGQAQHFARIVPMVQARVDDAAVIVKLRQESGFPAASAALMEGKGRQLMDGVRRELGAFEERQRKLLAERTALNDREVRSVRLLSYTGTGVSVVLLGGIIMLLQRENRLRSESEERLHESMRQLDAASRQNRLIMEHSLDVICTMDGEGRFVFVSAAAERLWGHKPSELAGRKYADLVHPDDQEKTAAAAAAVMAGEPVRDFENRYQRADGSTVPVVWTAAWSEADQTMYCVARDITERKVAEAALRALNDELEERVAQRTAELSATNRELVERESEVRQLNLELEARVRERTGQLESANKELEAFSYSVSHDLRAPLRHVDYFAGKLQKQLSGQQLDETARRCLTTIVESIQRMGRLIDDLLAFAKLGRGELRRSSVDLGELIAEIRRHLQTEINGRAVSWQVAALPSVQGDTALLRQVFSNLLHNAVKYTREKPEARIEIGVQASDARETVVYVRDNGAGFDMKYAPKLFGVFQRLHANTQFEGTGVGLATVARIVQRHGGRVWAEAAEQAGATFYVSLPSGTQTNEHPASP